ncbi:efflux RND transporter periplasmic adaptor subunit [Hymenobacter sp. BT188]|uniref:efflux RND transporter periplasmic adaptor subunit n=1 Tax=Hymenobacter sp. BT188 TaxID=2763504 RepID=UPI00165176E6|nr:efflux RND transporter periplasmic adaptor subunit [Hymenobacter sp. BT188]MBC6605762.1 efflux RND transporter periplasmic adaptor subunit [Hymenobacter sp. BT188]
MTIFFSSKLALPPIARQLTANSLTIRGFIYAAGLLLTVTSLSACQSKGESTGQRAEEPAATAPTSDLPPQALRISPAQAAAAGITLGGFSHQNMTSEVVANGVLDVPPQNHVSISAVMGGYVQQVKVLPGQYVKKGAVVAVLRHPDYLKLQQEYLQARARLRFLGQELERQQELDAEDVGSKRRLQQAQSEQQTELATERSLAGQLRLLGLVPERLRAASLSPSVSLTTPIGGYVKVVSINPGQFVNPQDVLVEVVDRSGLHLELKVFEKDIAQVRKGQRVLFTIPNSRLEQTLEARVFLVGQAFDDEARTVSVHAHLEPTSATLLPGQYVAARIQTEGARQQTLPEEAVIQAEELSYIFAREGTASTGYHFRRYQVKAGPPQHGDVTITPLEPLPDTTQLVRRGAYFLQAEFTKGQQE